MSNRHQASRRRSYARRQRELNHRSEHYVAVMDWQDSGEPYQIDPEWLSRRLDALVPTIGGNWPARRGVC